MVMNMSVISVFAQVVSSRAPLAGGSQVGYVIRAGCLTLNHTYMS